jgi:MFS family permease
MTAAERRWGLAAAIASIAVFGIGIGISGPLLSLTLEGRGTDSSITGLNAAASFVGVVLGPLLVPRLIARFGFKHCVLTAVPLNTVFFLLLKASDNLFVWFALRFVGGLVGSAIFAATEAWISQLAGDEGRGRTMGIYAATLSAGFAIGPIVLSQTGTAGWSPFIACAAISAFATLPLLGVKSGGGKSDLLGPHPLEMMMRMKPVVMIVVLFAMYEGTTMTLLPVWGERAGLSLATAAALISPVFVGAILFQIPVGLLSDVAGRAVTMRVCAGLGMVGAAALPALAAHAPSLAIVLVIWGGFTTGLYPIALATIGDRFKGADLVNANAALVIAYGLGAFIGPILGGAAMDFWNPHGIAMLLTALFAALLLITWWRGDRTIDGRSRGHAAG